MPRARVGKRARLRINSSQKQSHITFLADVLGENAIGRSKNFANVLAAPGECAQISARLGHEQRGADAVAGNIRHNDAEMSFHHGQVIEVIAARGFSRISHACDVEAVERRCSFRKEPLLNFPGHLELLLVLAQLPLGAFARSDVADERHVPALAVHFHVAETHLRDDFSPVLAAAHGFDHVRHVHSLTRAQIILDTPRIGAAQILRQQHAQFLSDDFSLLVTEHRLHRGIAEMNPAVRVHQQHSVRRRLPEQTVTQFAFQQLLARLAPFAAVRRFAQLAVNRRREPVQISLHQVIVRPGLHRRDRCRLADAAGDDDERREAREKLLESELRYRLLWESSPDAVLLMDSDSRIHFSNPAVETVFGYKQGEIIGKELRVLLPEDLRSADAKGIEDYLRTGERMNMPHVIETVGRRKDGREIVTEMSFSHMEMHGERRHVAFIRDITARKRAERELRENQEQFQVAREIQQRLFPQPAPALDGFDIAGVTYPAEATGGDYFDYLPMMKGHLGVIVADVTGHGIGPALLMAETRAYLRTLAGSREDIGEILTTANRILAEDIGEERYVTLFLGRIDPQTRNFSYASAGHPTGYVLGAGGEIKNLLKRTAVPLGINPNAKYDGAVQVGLQSGDIVLDRKSTRLNSSHVSESRMPSSA